MCLVVSSRGERVCLVVSSREGEGVLGCWQQGGRGCAWLLAAGEREGVHGCWQQGRERECTVLYLASHHFIHSYCTKSYRGCDCL